MVGDKPTPFKLEVHFKRLGTGCGGMDNFVGRAVEMGDTYKGYILTRDHLLSAVISTGMVLILARMGSIWRCNTRS